MGKKLLSAALALLLTAFVLGGTALAADERGAPRDAKRTLIPTRELTVADAVGMLVDGFQLDRGRSPQAGDDFKNVPDDAAYARDFAVALEHGLPLAADVDPEAKITKEFFADLLFHAMLTKGEFAFILLYVEIADEDEIDPRYMDSIQKLLIGGIMELDKEGRFHPQATVRAGVARGMMLKALRFVEKHAAPPADTSSEEGDVQLSVTPVTAEVNKITLSWGEKPNPGYALTIPKIEFAEPGQAIIYYELHFPDPDRMYPQVIVEPTASVYLDSNLQPVIRRLNPGPTIP
mgnify:CR=1 FL=1|jgi:hypothetical protein